MPNNSSKGSRSSKQPIRHKDSEEHLFVTDDIVSTSASANKGKESTPSTTSSAAIPVTKSSAKRMTSIDHLKEKALRTFSLPEQPKPPHLTITADDCSTTASKDINSSSDDSSDSDHLNIEDDDASSDDDDAKHRSRRRRRRRRRQEQEQGGFQRRGQSVGTYLSKSLLATSFGATLSAARRNSVFATARQISRAQMRGMASMAATTASTMTSGHDQTLIDPATLYGTSPSSHLYSAVADEDPEWNQGGGVTAASALVEMGGSGKVHKEEMEGSSTMQSIFNTVNLLLGLGLLSLPYALRCGGWIPGLTILISTAFITSYTAYILSRCLSLRPGRLLDFADIGEQAFGPHARSIVSILFISELFVTCVAFIILISDSLNALYPTFPMWGCRLVAFVACTGSTFVRQLKYISYASLVGIAASFNLVVVVVLDGVMKRERPGSLWEVEETRMVPRHLGSISLAFGIVMAGFAGHAVLPNIYLDMKDKTRFPHVLAVSFSIALSLYTLVAVCGYAMFGEMTLEEVTMNLAVPGNSVNPFLNVVTTGLIAFIPIPKYALTIAPVALALDQYTGLILHRHNLLSPAPPRPP